MGKITLLLCCAFVAFIPFEMMFYVENVSGAKVVGLISFSAAVLALLTGYRPRMFSRPITWRVVLAVWSGLVCFWSLAPAATTDGLPLGPPLDLHHVALGIRRFLPGPGLDLRSLLLGMLVPLSMQALQFAGVYRASESLPEGEAARVSGGGHDLNYLALMLAVSIVIAAYLATNPTKTDRRLRWGYWAFVALAALGALLTGSRGGLVCLFAAAFFALPVAGFSLRRVLQWFKYLAPLLLLAISLYFVLPAVLRSRLSEGTETAGTFTLRWNYWIRGLTYSLPAQPLVGIGFNAYSPVTTERSGVKTAVAHNVVISVLVELGVIGLMIYLAYLLSLYYVAWRMPPREKWLSLGLLTVLLVGALSSGSQLDKFSWCMQTMVATMAVACGGRPQRPWLGRFAGRGLPFGRRLRPPRGRPST